MVSKITLLSLILASLKFNSKNTVQIKVTKKKKTTNKKSSTVF